MPKVLGFESQEFHVVQSENVNNKVKCEISSYLGDCDRISMFNEHEQVENVRVMKARVQIELNE